VSPILLSVIYVCTSEVYVIREQLTCLSHLIASSFARRVRYEFLCFVPPDSKRLLAGQLSAVRVFRMKSDEPILRFMAAACYARGRLLVDARQLCYEIDRLKEKRPGEQFITMLCPAGQPSAFERPIAGEKEALIALFRSVHCTAYGAQYEMELLSNEKSAQKEGRSIRA
jgi:hypothetical protein